MSAPTTAMPPRHRHPRVPVSANVLSAPPLEALEAADARLLREFGIADAAVPAVHPASDAARPITDADAGVDAPASRHELNVVAAYQAHFREDPLAFLQQLWAYGSGSGWRGYTDYIGAPILYPSAAVEAIHRIVMSEAVQLRINQLATARANALLPDEAAPKSGTQRKAYVLFKQRKRAEMVRQLSDTTHGIAEKMVARLDSLPVLKLFAATVNNILGRLYHQGIHISLPEILALRHRAALAAERKQSIIFLPCHKSHIDYLTVSWLMFRVGVALPHIVAGDNLDMPLLGDFLRKGGAMFIRRSFKGDELYPVVIREYIEQILATGRNLECFVEGTRSRTGKLLPPKFGILSYIVDGFLAGRTSDVWICPVSLQYDSVIESETYVSELLGKPKESESLMGLLSGSSSLLQLKMGRIDIRFQEPWSLKAFIDAHRARRTGDRGAGATFDVAKPGDRMLLLKSLGYQVLGDINRVSVVMPAALVGTVILTLRGRGVGKRDLIRRVERLRSRILHKGYRVADFGTMATSEVVTRALGLMKGLVAVHDDLLEPTYEPVKRFELSFYRNQVIHCFVREILVAATLYTIIKQGAPPTMGRPGFMPRKDFVDQVSFLSWILRDEFIFTSGRLEDTVEATVQQLVAEDVFAVADDGSVGLSAKEISGGRETYDQYLFMVWPFIEGYWLAACALLCLMPDVDAPASMSEHAQLNEHVSTGDEEIRTATRQTEIAWVSAKEFEKRAQLFGKTLYNQGELSYLEATSIAVVQQALARYQEIGIVLRRPSQAARPVALMALNPEWQPAWEDIPLVPVPSQTTSPLDAPLPARRPTQGGRLWSHLARLGHFRREGKDRRENLVGQRILQHVVGNSSPVVERTRLGERRHAPRL